MKKFTSNFKLFLLLAAMVTGVSDAWGADVLANQGTSSVEIMNGWSTSSPKTYTLSGPGATLTFEVEKTSNVATGSIKVIAYTSSNASGTGVEIKTVGVGELSKNKWKSYSVNLTSVAGYRDFRSIKFEATGTLNKYVRSAQVTMAQYLDAPSETSLDLDSAKYGNTPNEKSLTVAWCNVPAMSYSITGANAGRFEVSVANNSEAGKYNTATFTVKYKHDAIGSHSATLVITDSYNSYRKEIPLSGVTEKKNQTITWTSEWSAEKPSITNGKTVSGAATASSGLGVTYSSSDVTIIKIVNGGTAFQAVAEGEAIITATQSGNDEWNTVSDTKTFKVTNKTIQMVVWTQNLSRLKTTDSSPIALTAEVHIVNPLDGSHTYNAERTALLAYSSDNSSVVSVAGNELTIVSEGTATLSASVAGDAEYEEAETEIPVRVRVPSVGCDDELVETDLSGEYEFFHYSLTSDMEKVVTIDRSTGIPGVMKFEYKGAAWLLSYKGSIEVYESTDGGATYPKKICTITPPKDNKYYMSEDFEISRNATHLKFFRDRSAEGYHLFKNIQITPAQYIEANVSAIDFGEIQSGSLENRTIEIAYSNIKSNPTIVASHSDLTLSDDVIDDDCGAWGTKSITITFAPTVAGDFNETITISDAISGKSLVIPVTATITKNNQVITWNPASPMLTTETVTFTDKTDRNLPISYQVTAGADVADFDGEGNFVIYKSGDVTIKASQAGDGTTNPAADVVRTITINKATPVVTTWPTYKQLVVNYPVSSLSLTGGEASVDGSFEWTNPCATADAEGSVDFNMTFIPTNADWYNSVSKDLAVTVFDAIIFDGSTDKDMDDADNWNVSRNPEETENVIIAADAVVSTDMEFHGLTIDAGKSVTVESGATLTIGAGGSRDATEYGDLIIKAGGQVVLSGADVKVRNFYINTELGDDTHAGVSSSSQLDGSTHLDVLGDAFIDIKMDPSGSITYGFYDFVLPFPCDAKTGVSYIDATGAEHPMVLNRDYAFSAYSEATRATGAYAWKRFNGVLEAGLAYSITLDDDYKDRNLIRFRKTAIGAINTSDKTALQVSDGNDTDKGWNGIGNATLSYADLNSAGVSTVQVYSHATNSYSPVAIDAFTYVVGSSFFVQVGSAQDMTFVRQDNPSVLRAPSRAADEANEQFMIEFAAEQSDYTADRLYLSADEDALSTYEIGRDLLKFGNPTEAKKAQISGLGYGKNLCQMHFPMLNNEAIFPLSLFAPAAGDYVLRAAEVVDGQDLYLLENGVPVWNLSDGEYTLSLNKGSNTDYSLAIRANAPAVPTGADTVASDSDVEKIIINGVLFVRKNGMIFDAMGNRVK